MFSLPNEIRRDLKAAGMSDKMVHDGASLEDAGSLH
jgi:4-hydroxy-3-methylbut-2-enyl diphosphate reductase